MVNPTGNPYGDLASTVHHELLHVKHPSMSETKIRKKEKRDMKRMGKAQKVRLLDKLR